MTPLRPKIPGIIGQRRHGLPTLAPLWVRDFRSHAGAPTAKCLRGTSCRECRVSPIWVTALPLDEKPDQVAALRPAPARAATTPGRPISGKGAVWGLQNPPS